MASDGYLNTARSAVLGHAKFSPLSWRCEFAAGRFAEPTVAKLLDTVGNCANEQVSTQPRRLGVIQAPRC